MISLALLARLVVRGRPRWVGVPALLWMAFGAWYFVALVEGILHHNNTTQIPYEGKAIIYVVGGYAWPPVFRSSSTSKVGCSSDWSDGRRWRPPSSLS